MPLKKGYSEKKVSQNIRTALKSKKQLPKKNTGRSSRKRVK